jgi:parallel beta-helix repeat protein
MLVGIKNVNSSQKFHRLLILSLKPSSIISKDAIHRLGRNRVNAKPLVILIIIISAVVLASVAASVDMFSLSRNNESPQLAIDTTLPTIGRLSDVVAEATGPLTTVPLTPPTVTDDADPTPSLTYDAPFSDGYSLGTSIITWTAEDAAGNIATVVQKVMLVDTIPPLIAAPSDVVVNVGSSIHYTHVSLGTLTVEDLVDSYPDVTNDAPSFGFPIGVTTVTWKAVDASGNSATDTQLVSVIVIEDNGEEENNTFSSTGGSGSSRKASSSSSTSGSSSTSNGGGSSGSGSSSGGSGSDSSDNGDTDRNNSGAMEWPVVDSSDSNSFTATGSNFFDIPDDPSLRLEKFTLAAWFKTTKDYSRLDVKSLIANKGGFGSDASGKNKNYGIWVEDGSTHGNKIGAGFETSSGLDVFVMSSSKYNDGIWHYAVVTHDLSVLKLYIDGVVVAEKSTTDLPDTLGTQPLRIGANSLTADRFFTGDIDEVKLWNRALTASEVMDRYDDSPSQPPSSTPPTGVDYTIPTIGGEKPTDVTYGATVHTVCDSGCTHKTIRSAIDSLPSSGGKVVLKAPRTFTPGSTISLRANLVIEFEKGATMEYSGSGPVFSGKKINNVMFLNPVISRSDAGDVLFFSNADTVIVEGGKITGVKGSQSSGFKCLSCKNVLVEDGSYSTFSRPIKLGTTSGSTDRSTSNVWFVGNKVSDSSIECMQLNRGYDIHAIGNNVKDCTNNGIDVGFNVRVEARDNRLTNTGYGSDDNAVGFHTDGANTVVLLENIIDGTGTDGISICGSDNNYVVGNTISDTGETPEYGGGNGIEVIRCEGNTSIPEKTIIDSNQISKIATAGIYITSTAADVQITNNTIQNYRTSDILDSSKEAIISANTS